MNPKHPCHVERKRNNCLACVLLSQQILRFAQDDKKEAQDDKNLKDLIIYCFRRVTLVPPINPQTKRPCENKMDIICQE